MLELSKLLWVLPGVTFIYIYNKRRPSGRISLSGWSYIFFLVAVAVIVWIPVKNAFHNFSCESWQDFFIAVTSAFISCILALVFTSWEALSKFIFLPEHDIFFINCNQWKNKPVILSLKNDKIYVGILLKYSRNPRSNYESQMISILPLISGGRGKDTKKVIWGGFYPEDKTNPCEIIIPRSEIITLGDFNEKVFQHFYEDDKYLSK